MNMTGYVLAAVLPVVCCLWPRRVEWVVNVIRPLCRVVLVVVCCKSKSHRTHQTKYLLRGAEVPPLSEKEKAIGAISRDVPRLHFTSVGQLTIDLKSDNGSPAMHLQRVLLELASLCDALPLATQQISNWWPHDNVSDDMVKLLSTLSDGEESNSMLTRVLFMGTQAVMFPVVIAMRSLLLSHVYLRDPIDNADWTSSIYSDDHKRLWFVHSFSTSARFFCSSAPVSISWDVRTCVSAADKPAVTTAVVKSVTVHPVAGETGSCNVGCNVLRAWSTECLNHLRRSLIELMLDLEVK